MQKRNRDRNKLWLALAFFLVGTLFFSAFLAWQLNTKSPRVRLRYGDLVQTLRASSKGAHLNLQDVQISHSDVRGEIVSTDRVSTGGDTKTDTQTIPFQTLRTGFERDPELYGLLRSSIGADYQGAEEDSALRVLGNALTTILLFGMLLLGVLLMLRWMSGGGSPFTFGRSKARLHAQKDLEVTFRDVAGIDEAVAELREVVDFLSHPDKYQALGGRIPKGVLLVGPPGTGKTLLARAVAGEAGVPFFSLSGSEFVEMFVGVGAARVRDLFTTAESKAPCITGDAVVTLTGGRTITIQELFDRRMTGVRVPAMTDDFRLEDATVIGITRKPCPALYEISTNTSTIRATGNHLFPVLTDVGLQWRRADELAEGDYVAAPRRVRTTQQSPHFSAFLDPDQTLVKLPNHDRHQVRPRLREILERIEEVHSQIQGLSIGKGGFTSSYLRRAPLHLTEDVAYLCGLIASNGCFGKPGDRTILFINTELALHARLRSILEEAFGCEPKLRLNTKHYNNLLPQGRRPVLQDCYTTYIGNKLLCEALRTIQGRVLELPERLIAAWLRGVFDGDGSVRCDPRTPQVVISAWNRQANQFIRDALLRIGIVTSLSPGASSGRDGNIVLTGRETLQAFLRLVGSSHPAKQARLASLALRHGEPGWVASRLDVVPVRGLLKKARCSVGMGQRRFFGGPKVTLYERGRTTPARSHLQAVVERIQQWCDGNDLEPTADVRRLAALAESDILWARVRSVRSTPPVDYVYDLCLDRHHCFIANNLVVHNCIVFVDELDALGKTRAGAVVGGHDEREQTLNQLLVEMDGFSANKGVILMAATNRPETLDPALLRPGRFDRTVVVDRPDINGREAILKVHVRHVRLGPDVDLRRVASLTPGTAGADLANLVNEAALMAARSNREHVAMTDFDEAVERSAVGLERKSRIMNAEEKNRVAYHEAGHALVACSLPNTHPVHKISIIPRGVGALGYVLSRPDEDRYLVMQSELESRIKVALGGTVAEEMIFHEISNGATSDLEQASDIARRMVKQFGMSRLGRVCYQDNNGPAFLNGSGMEGEKAYSEETAREIDLEVRKIIDEATEDVRDVLQTRRMALEAIALRLMEKEVMDSRELRELLDRHVVATS